MIAVVDYDAGNGPSVLAALSHLGHEAKLVSSGAELPSASHVILPGVGSAASTLRSLRELDLLEPIERVVRAGTPFLGICVGLQILFEHSEEDDVTCLGWFKGRVRRYSGPGLRVPQIGWNVVRARRPHPVLDGLPEAGHFYFVNSYYVTPESDEIVLGETDYGTRFTALIASKNVVAAQFHIEKSGPLGLRLLDNFVRGAAVAC